MLVSSRYSRGVRIHLLFRIVSRSKVFLIGKSRIIALQAPLPMGLFLGDEASRPGITCIDEVVPNGNGANVGVMQGDIVRAITACQTTAETSSWQLIAGGIGQPKTK